MLSRPAINIVRSGLAALLLCLAMVTLSGPRAHAAGISVLSQQSKSAFPDGILFNITATSDVKVTQARLRFQILPEGPSTSAAADCNGDTTVNCTKTIGGHGGIYVVPFSQLKYHWEIQDASGATYNTDDTTVTYDDTRFKWQSLVAGNLTVYYYKGDDATIRKILDAGRDAIDRMSKLEGTTVDFPVKVLDYATARDLQPAVASSRDGGNSIVLGEVASSDTAIETREVFGSNEDPLDTVRHELTHVVTGHATKDNPNLDIWLNEGISVYAQSMPDAEFLSGLDRAIKSNTAYPISSLNSSSLRSNNPDLFYGESYSIVKYLVDTYGAAKFTQFIQALDHDLVPASLQKVYGIDIDGLEAGWRKSVGLPALAPSTAPSQSNDSTKALPTFVPFGAQSSSSSSSPKPTPAAGTTSPKPAATKSSGGSSAVLPIAVSVVILVIVVAAAVLLAKRRKRRAQPPGAA